ncbi:hypothetical protein SAMN02910298_01593 [Pseudobutyrivibrio sp. YE44]|uniref:DUF6465 family protein n=1 Tax=Pseudobutyrivibrio sp. YE44 TaxID=1520802 RepID=UPI00088C2408|nr:DUF6465 family protein [Pseudobutyrivibrio sp. YE44]SDB33067.1 hypothetical protein SAMN02910298_01593 [Pseudobutyrivibrio sp. YE44]
MVTNAKAKVTVEDIKKSAASAATTVKAATASATEATKKAVEEVKKEATAATKKATAAKKTAAKKATTAKKTATKTVKKTAAKAKKKAVSTSAVVQYQGMEFSETDCLKKAQAAFKKEYKGKTLEELNIYIKPEERKIYYVANKDCVGSVDL